LAHPERITAILRSEIARLARLTHARAETPEFAISQRARRKVEALFAKLKNYIGLRRLRLRRMRFVREQFYLAATAAEPETAGAI
jgi:DDE family transposase